MITVTASVARYSRMLLCATWFSALVACSKETTVVAGARVAAAASNASSRELSGARQLAAPNLAPLPDALSPNIGGEWNSIRAEQVAENAMERSTDWAGLGLCSSACRVDARMLMEAEDPSDGAGRHLMVLAISGSEADGAGAMFQGTAIGICSFERKTGNWTLTECREDAARVPYGYGDYDALEAVIRSDSEGGVVVVVDWAKTGTGERSRYLAFLRRVDGRFTTVLELSTGVDTMGNYADRPDIEASWRATWDFQRSATTVPDILTTATGNEGLRHIDCRARFRFDGRQYVKAEASASRESCPWADEEPPKSAASAASV